MQNSCFRPDVWETVIELITHLHSFSFGINLSLSLCVSLSVSLWLRKKVGLRLALTPSCSCGVGGALHKPRLSMHLLGRLRLVGWNQHQREWTGRRMNETVKKLQPAGAKSDWLVFTSFLFSFFLSFFPLPLLWVLQLKRGVPQGSVLVLHLFPPRKLPSGPIIPKLRQMNV